MATIHIKNFGPISDSGVITLNIVTLLIGRQGAGKSTFMKILCFCRWIEKRIMTSDEDIVALYTHNNRFIKEMMAFDRFNDMYFSDGSCIHYVGDTIDLLYEGKNADVSITIKEDFTKKRYNTKLCFIPSERNLVSVINNVDKTYRASARDMLFNFIFEWDEARENYTQEKPLRLSASSDIEYVYDNGIDRLQLIKENQSFSPYFASSGVQSVLPIDVMVDYICGLAGKTVSITKHELTNTLLEILQNGGENVDASTREKLSGILKNSLAYQSVQLFIEEPEQNLYPSSQRTLIFRIISSLREAISASTRESMVVMTTHSPYILSVLNVLIRAAELDKKKPAYGSEVLDEGFILPPEDYSAYYIKDDGSFENVINEELPMISGDELDGVSDWVDDKIAEINSLLYGE